MKGYSFSKVMLLIFMPFCLVSCGGKSSPSESEKMGEKDSSEISESKEASSKSVYGYNQLSLGELGLYIEVLYEIDTDSKKYKEWVKLQHNNNIKVSHFEFDYSRKKYGELIPLSQKYFNEYYENESAEGLSDEELKMLSHRFDNNSTIQKFEVMKQKLLPLVKPKNNVLFKNSCESLWDQHVKKIKYNYSVRLQRCKESKYSKLAAEDTSKFLNENNRFLFYPGLFGFWDVYPQGGTFLEISLDGKNFLGLGTVYSPKNYTMTAGDKNRIGRGECSGDYLFKTFSNLSKDQEVFIGSQNEPIFMDSMFFIKECSEKHREYSDEISEIIVDLFPEASGFFRRKLRIDINGYLYVHPIDEYISKKLDEDVLKYSFRTKNYKNSTDQELYDSWKEVVFNRYELRFTPASLFFEDVEGSYLLLADYVLHENRRREFFGVNEDLYYEEDKRALEDLKKFIFIK